MPDHPVSFVANYWALMLLTLGLFGLRFATQRTPRLSGAVMTEALTVYAAYLFYFMVRGLVKDQRPLAFDNARRIVELEQRLGPHIEESLQAAIIDQEHIVRFMNWIYVWAHWPVAKRAGCRSRPQPQLTRSRAAGPASDIVVRMSLASIASAR